MKLYTGIDSIEARIQKNILAISSKTPLKILSSAVLNGGLREANCIINVHVAKERDDAEIHKAPEEFIKKEASKLNLPHDDIVGIMTAADLRNVAVKSQKLNAMTLTALVTAGTSFSATIGDEIASKKNISTWSKGAGTINTIMLVDGNLTDSCMVGAVKTITEAKTVALRELDIRSRFSRDLASGTITDSVVIACTKRGDLIKYAGAATELGELIGKSVREASKEAIFKQEGTVPNRPLAGRLEERGISLEKMMTAFSQTHPLILKSGEKLQRFKEELQRILSDQSIASLVAASFRSDDDARGGLIPGPALDSNSMKSEVCEILQSAVVDYLSNRKDSLEQIILNDSSSFLEDNRYLVTRSVLLAIMNYVYSNLL
jgi:adenosylcobinamide hydrolase